MMAMWDSSHPRFAVVGADGVYLDSGRRQPLPDSRDLNYWLAAMTARGIDELWLHPACGWRWLDADADAAEAVGWTVQGAADELKGAPWWTAARPGQYGMRHIIQTAYEDRAPWREAPDALALRAAILAYHDALTIPYHRSPGATGTRLLRRLHSGAHATRLDLPTPLPAPATRGADDGPMLWRRALTPAETRRRYLHSYDVNGQYLAACSSVALGVGAPVHRDGAAALALLANPKALPPGYWRITGAEGLPQDPSPLENTTRRGWWTTPTLRLLLDLGADVRIAEAWVWPESKRYLEPWYQVIREGRSALMSRTDAAARIALGVLKRTYTTTVNGWMVSTRWDRAEDALWRPDWSAHVRALARANLYRTIARVTAATGANPFFTVAEDALYLVSDEPDALAAAPEGLRISPALGHFKVKDSLPLAEASVLRRQGWTVNGLQRQLNAIRAAQEVSHATA